MFYLPNGITHNIYVYPMIHGEVSSISFLGYLQAFWRGFALRRRLASALAAVTCPDSGEDETFEEVDMDEFVFDEVCTQVCVIHFHGSAILHPMPHQTHKPAQRMIQRCIDI